MIEKLMKAVKSSNKKRGRNITVGAVVGMLLSCTVAMGDEIVAGLDITTSGGIEFSKDGNPFIPGNEEDPYPDNRWNAESKTYTNNSTIKIVKDINTSDIRVSGINADITGEGINEIANNGMINVSATSSYSMSFAYGINIFSSVDNKKIGNIINDGVIDAFASGSSFAYSYGIGTDDSKKSIKVDNIINNGLINSSATGSECFGYGIYNYKATVAELKNTGRINASHYGIKIDSRNGSVVSLINDGMINTSGHGIEVSNSGKIDNITNTGMINASGYSGYGIDVFNNGTFDNITNTGAIYGKSSAIQWWDSNLASGNNYGLLMSGNSSGGVIYSNNLSIVAHDDSSGGNNKIKNYGLAFIYDGTDYIARGKDTSQFPSQNVDYPNTYGQLHSDISIDGVSYDIINVGASEDGSSKKITDIKSFGIKNGALYKDIDYDNDNASSGWNTTISSASTDKVILNGIENTLKVSGNSNSLSNAVINAYGTAVEFLGTTGTSLTLSGTTVNGGAKENTFAISGSAGDDILILESKTITVNENQVTQNTIINGNIDMGAGANEITLKNDSVVNGGIKTGAGVDKIILENKAMVNGKIEMQDGNDELTIGTGSFVNGDIDMGAGTDNLTIGAGSFVNGILDGGTGDNDILTFGTNSGIEPVSIAEDNANDNINISHDIKGFEKINVGTKVTFSSDSKVTDATEIEIGTDGVLVLNVDKNTESAGKITGHALYNLGGIVSSTGGRLLLDLNGAEAKQVITFGSTTLTGLVPGDDQTFDTTSKVHTIKAGVNVNEVIVEFRWDVPEILKYKKLNEVYHGIGSVNDLIGNFNITNDEELVTFIAYLNNIYAGNPYSYSSELSRKSAGMFRDIVTDNQFKSNTGKWMIYGGLTHVDGGTKDTYYGKGYYTYDIGSSDMDADTKITGTYMLGEYGISDTLTSGVVIGGNKLKSDLSNGSKVDGSALYLGAYAKKYLGNLKVTAGIGFQYGDYDADRLAVNKVASSTAESVMKYSDNYNDMTYDIYLNGRYSHNIGKDLFLEPYTTLSYTYVDQDGANEGSKVLAIETDSKSFDYTVGKVGVDLKKVIPHEKGKSTLTAGVSYTKILDGADEEHITGRFKGGSDFDILVAHKNEHSIGLNAKYALELENGIIFDVKGTYSVERDSHNQSGKNRTKGEWIVGAGVGYKF